MATDAEVLRAAEAFSEASSKWEELKAAKKKAQDGIDSLNARIAEAKAQRDAASATLKSLAATL